MKPRELSFDEQSGPARFHLPVGEFFLEATFPVEWSVNGYGHGRLKYLRLAVLDVADVEVAAPAHCRWRVTPLRNGEPVDPVPHEALLREPAPETMEQMLRRFIREESSARAAVGDESFDEANDFAIGDEEDLPPSPGELLDAALEEAAGLSDEDVLLKLDERRKARQQPAEAPTAPAASAPSASAAAASTPPKTA